MDKKVSQELVKRIKSDRVICRCITVVAIAAAVIYLIRFITTLLSQNYGSNDLQGYACSFTEIAFISGGLICLCLALKEVCLTGRPFSQSIVKKLRVMAILLLVSVPIAYVVTSLTGFLDPLALTVGYHVTAGDIMVIIFGGIMMMIAEMFNYGVKLEEEMEQIA